MKPDARTLEEIAELTRLGHEAGLSLAIRWLQRQLRESHEKTKRRRKVRARLPGTRQDVWVEAERIEES